MGQKIKKEGKFYDNLLLIRDRHHFALWLNSLISIFLITSPLFSYIYNHNHWLHIPVTNEVISITASLSNVYVAVPDGILVFDKRNLQFTNTFTKADGIPEGIKICAYDIFSGNLLIIDEEGLTFFQPFTRIRSNLPLPFKPHSLGIGKENIYFQMETENQAWNRKKRKFKRVKVFPDTGIVWYGAAYRKKPQDYIFLTPYYIMDEDLIIYPMTGTFEEGKRLWVSVRDYGILVYDLPSRQKIKEFRFGLMAGGIKEILKREDGLWFLGNNFFIRMGKDLEDWKYFLIRPGKIFSEKIPLLSFKFLDIFRTQGITAISENPSLLLFSTSDKLYLYEKKSENIINEVNIPSIQKIFSLKDTVFILSSSGVFLYSLTKNEISELKDPKGDLKFGVYDIGVNNFGIVFAIRGGFLQLNYSKKWEKFILPGIDLSLPITNIAAANDYLFFGIREEGLIAFDQKENKYISLKEKEGLLSTNIQSLYCDSSYLWISTDKGISRFDYHQLF